MLLFGNKTQAFFDLWSIEHFMSGMAMVLIVRLFFSRYWPEICSHQDENSMISKKKCYFIMLTSILVLALFWESFEFYMEAGYSGNAKITYWFQGVEFWGNRLITDPILTVLGGYVGLRYVKLALPARILSAIWLGVHIFVFPHSMYLQDML